MRTAINSILILLLTIFLTPLVYAQLQTDSNTVRTRVGDPKEAPILTNIPSPPQDIRQGILETFGVTMNGFDQDHLRWTWERLWEISQTKFTELIRGSRVEATTGLSTQVGCFGGSVSLYLGQYQPREFFKFIILHEFAHIIQACHPRSVSFQIEQQNAFSQEGAVSYYAANASSCSGSNSYNEDYADMLAYYLDVAAGLSSGPKGCGASNPPNPYINGFGTHKEVAGRILLQ